MKTYDTVIVLGSQPDIKTWQFPTQVYECLDKAKEALAKNQVASIIVSGKWSIALDTIGIKQPFRECDKMADYLISSNVPEDLILKEVDSKDSISNLYFIKTGILIPKNYTKILFIVADFRIPRLTYLCNKILGSEYEVGFLPITSEVGSTYNEPNTFEVQKRFLEPMKDGDHDWLKDKFYTAPMYEYWAREDLKKYMQKMPHYLQAPKVNNAKL